MGTKFVIQQVIVLGILMAVGYVATKKNIINEEISSGLARILTNIALPALIISSFNLTYSKDTIKGVVMMLIYSIVINLVTIIMGKLVFKRYSKDKEAILKFGTVFSNSAFMGLPLILEFFGQEGLLYASIFTIAYHGLIWTYGEGLLAEKGQGLDLKKLRTNPPLIAIGLGAIIFIFKINIPYIIDKPISMLSVLTLPLAMLILGEKITKLDLREIITDKDIYYGCFIKLIITPLLALGFLKIMNADPLLAGTIVTIQALPAAVLLVVLTQRHEGNIEFASKFTIVSHIISIITIPLIIIGTGIMK